MSWHCKTREISNFSCDINYELNCIVICMRPEMAMNSGSRSATDVCGFAVNSYQRVLLFTLIVTQNKFV